MTAPVHHGVVNHGLGKLHAFCEGDEWSLCGLIRVEHLDVEIDKNRGICALCQNLKAPRRKPTEAPTSGLVPRGKRRSAKKSPSPPVEKEAPSPAPLPDRKKYDPISNRRVMDMLREYGAHR